VDDSIPDENNDTSEIDLYYFARIKNHYLRLVQSSEPVSAPSRHKMKFPVVADSGANHHMFKEKEFFSSITPMQGQVILGDGKARLKIQGIGTINCLVDGHPLMIEDVCYVPDLAESVYSSLLHIKQPQHGLKSSFEEGLHITFPQFTTKALVGNDNIYLNATPYMDYPPDLTTSSDIVNHEHAIRRNLVSYSDYTSKCSPSPDNLLRDLQRYYSTVKTKRQLSMDEPTGFRQSNQLQKDFQQFLPPNSADSSSSAISKLANLQSTQNTNITESMIDQSSGNAPTFVLSNDPSSDTNSSSTTTVLIVRCVDKCSSSLPSCITFLEDFIRSSVGFRRIDTLKHHLNDLYWNTVKIDSTPPDAVLVIGDLATIRKSARNTTPVPRPNAFGEVIHMDIVFGPDVSLGNIHYGLLFTDRYSRMTYIYPLQNLTTDIRKQLEAFFAHLGFTPKRLVTDFDTKLIGGKARDYLNSLLIHVNAAPTHRQDKNGLAERHWQILIAMARNWLTSAELPATFCFYAVKRVAEICNYFPNPMLDGTWSTPFQLAHGTKPDLCVLFKMFGLAAVKRERQGDSVLGKFKSQSILMIAVGRCPNSTGIQFYNHANGTFVSSIDYRFQNHVTSGAHFGLRYQPGVYIYCLDESNSLFAPKYPSESSVFIHTHSPPTMAKVIGIPTYSNPNVYTVTFRDGSIAKYTDDDLLSLVPPSHTSVPSLLPHWVKGGCNATIFLSTMPKPRHGILHLSTDSQWIFQPGKTVGDHDGILLPDLEANCQQLLETGQLFRGHAKFKHVFDTRNQISLQTSVL